MHRIVILALRVLLVLIALGTLGTQIVLVVLATTHVPESERLLAVTYAVLGAAAIGCVQVGLLALWVLLGMVRRDAIFDERAFGWVRVIPVAGVAAAVLVATLCAHFGEVDDAPGLILIGGGIAVSGAAFALLMTVMHGLLRSAVTLRRELDEVV